MTCLHTELGQNIERLRTEYAAASTPAGASPSLTDQMSRRGQDDPDNRGRSAHVFEQFNEERFGDELDALHVIGLWAMCAVIFGGVFVSAMILHHYINQFFAWLGL